ncbi:hypothetical protein [Rouxiella badensis]|uniref:hypothetical protein n=1 Tax=Rouxiella badensis TaxID=1646377 RepID=UPI001CE43C49|nr:hypothetical protein [Rouxiella badensis]
MMSTLTALSRAKKPNCPGVSLVMASCWHHLGAQSLPLSSSPGLLAPWITGHDPYTQDLLNTCFPLG